MYSFFSIWALLQPQGEYKRRRGACERLWAGYDEPTRQRVYEKIAAKLARGEFVNRNPYFAIEDNEIICKTTAQTMTYAAYYRKYGTTEERDGWRMVNPTGNQVMYVKQSKQF